MRSRSTTTHSSYQPGNSSPHNAASSTSEGSNREGAGPIMSPANEATSWTSTEIDSAIRTRVRVASTKVVPPFWSRQMAERRFPNACFSLLSSQSAEATYLRTRGRSFTARKASRRCSLSGTSDRHAAVGERETLQEPKPDGHGHPSDGSYPPAPPPQGQLASPDRAMATSAATDMTPTTNLFMGPPRLR